MSSAFALWRILILNYGKNVENSYGEDEDAHPGEMVAEACLWAEKQGVDFSQYDWDGDGEVDQVFVLYAGMGEADGGSASTIWPHMYYLSASDYGKALTLDGVTVDTYACSAELNGNSNLDGIGTFCHEFSIAWASQTCMTRAMVAGLAWATSI